ncbi:protein transport protein Sec24A-like [Artemia franciscana]|uniref:protein transport protein Sec24A-like n=1 Tax=Artemia franciscana TaxID=6661 RepID=UPI0032DB8F17
MQFSNGNEQKKDQAADQNASSPQKKFNPVSPQGNVQSFSYSPLTQVGMFRPPNVQLLQNSPAQRLPSTPSSINQQVPLRSPLPSLPTYNGLPTRQQGLPIQGMLQPTLTPPVPIYNGLPSRSPGIPTQRLTQPLSSSVATPLVNPPSIKQAQPSFAGRPFPIPPRFPNNNLVQNAPSAPPSRQPGALSNQPSLSQRQFPVPQQPPSISKPPVMNGVIDMQPGVNGFQGPMQANMMRPIQPSGQQHPQNYASMQQTYQNSLNAQFNQMSVTQSGFNRIWGTEAIDLLTTRDVLPPEGVTLPAINLQKEHLNQLNCSSDIMRCTLRKIPETQSILEKARLPLGILIHPFKDLQQLPVVTTTNITRCKYCRTYINPFVYFIDQRRWKCNICFKANEFPEDFLYDPGTKQYLSDPSRRPEAQNSTIEYIAPCDYMTRAPPPATYVFVLETSRASICSGYLKVFSKILLEEFDRIPGDARAQFAFLTFSSSIDFVVLDEGATKPKLIPLSDIDEIFIPKAEGLLAKRSNCEDLIRKFLEVLPDLMNVEGMYENTGSCLGSALQAASKLAWPTGGRISVFLNSLPTIGPGALKERPRTSSGLLLPATDFYKNMALDNTGQQIATDLFFIGHEFQDIATVGCVAKFSSGSIYKFPNFCADKNELELRRFESTLRRYLTRKIGFEAVMRIRCTSGLSIHTFHGNMFVRSTDLIQLANVNPDAGFGLQFSITDSMAERNNVCFQAAVLYTSSKGERRIRVHTLSLPLTPQVSDVISSADQQCIVGLLAKIAVDRSMATSISDAREAFLNAAVDPLSAYKALQNVRSGQLLAPPTLSLLPVYILALLKTVAFCDQAPGLDERVFDWSEMKTLPLPELIQHIYPDLYAVHTLDEEIDPPRLQLSSEKVDTTGIYLMDAGSYIFILVGRTSPPQYCRAVFGVDDPRQVETMYELPTFDTTESDNLRKFIDLLQNEKSYPAAVQVFRDEAPEKTSFFNRLVEDKTKIGVSYFEFLQQLKTKVK